MKGLFLQILPISYLAILFASSSYSQEGWQGIVPLVTTTEQVERKLGKPGANGFYEFDDKRVLIDYVEVSCDKIKRCDCLVPLGTVQFVDVWIYFDLNIKDLNLDPKKFRKTNSTGHVLGIVTYHDWESGVVYESQDGKVTHIYYYESKATCDRIEHEHD